MENSKNVIKLEQKDIVQMINEIVRTVYHGTPFKTSAEGIMSIGLGGTKNVRVNGGKGAPSGEGRQYLTSSPGNAARYAMMNDEEPNGYVFQFNIDDENESFGVDEDELGYVIYQYLNGERELPFRPELLNYFTKKELMGIKTGYFRYFSMTKKIQDKLTRQEIMRILTIVNNVTSKSTLKPEKAWVIRKPSDEEKKVLFKSKDYAPFDEYFYANSREIKI